MKKFFCWLWRSLQGPRCKRHPDVVLPGGYMIFCPECLEEIAEKRRTER